MSPVPTPPSPSAPRLTPATTAALAADPGLRDRFGYGAKMMSRDEVMAEVIRDHEAQGAMFEPDGVGIHATRLAFGYCRLARELGAKVHSDSPVEGWVYRDGRHHLRTPGGTVRARKVAVATAGYAPRGLHARLRDRLLPIMSNSVVTRVLTGAELAEVGAKVGSPLTDTRTLRHYYRLLPDNRLQIGSRAAIATPVLRGMPELLGTRAVEGSVLDRPR